MSFCAAPIVPEIKAVIPPHTATSKRILGAYSSMGEQRISRNTPAVTMVAACISAETGVGPSIASGNHVCKPTWADLPTAPIKKNTHVTSSKSEGI